MCVLVELELHNSQAPTPESESKTDSGVRGVGPTSTLTPEIFGVVVSTPTLGVGVGAAKH